MKILLGAAAVVGTVFAVSPASAAMMNCAGDGLAKANTAVSAMPWDNNRMMATAELSKASTALSKGDMRGCNMAVGKIGKMAAKKKM